MGIKRVLSDALNSNSTDQKRVLIVTDCLSAILAIKYFPNRPHTQKIKKVHSDIISEILWMIYVLDGQGGKILFYKVKSHYGIFGNSAADAKAKASLSGTFGDESTAHMQLHAMSLTMTTPEGELLSRPVFRTIRQHTHKVVIEHLEQYNSQYMNQLEGTEPLSQLIDPARFGQMAYFNQKCRCDRLRLPTRRHVQSECQTCPACGEDLIIDLRHFLFDCECTKEVREGAREKLRNCGQGFHRKDDLMERLAEGSMGDAEDDRELIAMLMGRIDYRTRDPVPEEWQVMCVRPAFKAITVAYYGTWKRYKAQLYGGATS